jgi:hypothetical protein
MVTDYSLQKGSVSATFRKVFIHIRHIHHICSVTRLKMKAWKYSLVSRTQRDFVPADPETLLHHDR